MKNLTLFHDVEKSEIYLTHLFRVFADKEIFFKNMWRWHLKKASFIICEGFSNGKTKTQE